MAVEARLRGRRDARLLAAEPVEVAPTVVGKKRPGDFHRRAGLPYCRLLAVGRHRSPLGSTRLVGREATVGEDGVAWVLGVVGASHNAAGVHDLRMTRGTPRVLFEVEDVVQINRLCRLV